MKRPDKRNYVEDNCLDTVAYECALNIYIDALEENAYSLYFGVAKVLLEHSDNCLNKELKTELEKALRKYKPIMLKR